jgi:hypothetical protein
LHIRIAKQFAGYIVERESEPAASPTFDNHRLPDLPPTFFLKLFRNVLEQLESDDFQLQSFYHDDHPAIKKIKLKTESSANQPLSK